MAGASERLEKRSIQNIERVRAREQLELRGDWMTRSTRGSQRLEHGGSQRVEIARECEWLEYRDGWITKVAGVSWRPQHRAGVSGQSNRGTEGKEGLEASICPKSAPWRESEQDNG